MIPLDYKVMDENEMLAISDAFYKRMKTRRSVRMFKDKEIPLEVLRNCLKTASSAPSGANLQPWSFVVVTDPELKKQIREAAEKEERAFYESRASDQWLEDLKVFDTGPEKPFLETAPALIVAFSHPRREEGEANYYVRESVGIAVGFLISALHHAGLCSLTHTPSPMRFLEKLLKRPENERAYLLMPVGYPADDCVVPDIKRRSIDDTVTFL